MPAIIFKRLIIDGCSCLGGPGTSCSTPSILYLIRNLSSSGSTCISEARFFTASEIIWVTSFIIGASSFSSSFSTSPAAPLKETSTSASFFCATASRRSEEHTSELQSQFHLVCRLLLEKKNNQTYTSLLHLHLYFHSPCRQFLTFL